MPASSPRASARRTGSPGRRWSCPAATCATSGAWGRRCSGCRAPRRRTSPSSSCASSGVTWPPTATRSPTAPPAAGDGWRAAVTRAAAFCGAALLAAIPQLVIKSIIHGSALRTGTLNRYFWDAPRLLDVGFASEHGLFLWTPVLLVSVAGLLMLCRRDPVAGAGLLAAFASTYYVVSCYEAWHGISSFGNRFFVGLTPAFVVGAAVALQGAHALLAPRLSTAGASIALALSVALLAAWNAGLVFQWGTSMVPRQGPVDFALVARNQVTAVPRRIAGLALRYVAARQETPRQQARQDQRRVPPP